MNEELEAFYKALKTDGKLPDDLDFKTFESRLKSTEDRQDFYDALQLDNILPEDLDFKTFENRIGFDNQSYISEVWDHLKAVAKEGKLRGELASELPTFTEDASDFTNFKDDELTRQADLFKRYRENSEMLNKEVGTEDDGFIVEAFETIGGFFSEVAKSLIGSVVDTINTPGEATAAFTTGAITGAAISGPVATGLTATGVGAPLAAGLSAVTSTGLGITTAYAASAADIGAGLEFYSRLEAYAAEQGLDITKKSDLKKIYKDEEFLKVALSAANTKGSVEGAFEAVGGIIAPGVSKFATNTLGTKSPLSRHLTRKLAESQVEGIVGGTGAVVGTVSANLGAGEEIDAKELWAEFKEEYLVEAVTGGIVSSVGSAGDRLINKNKNRTKDAIIDAAIKGDKTGFRKGLEASVEQGVIPTEGLDYIMSRYDEVVETLKSVPQDIIKNKLDRREVVKKTLEKEFVGKRLSELESEKIAAADANIAKAVDKKIKKVKNRQKAVDKELSFLTNKAIEAPGSIATESEVSQETAPEAVSDLDPENQNLQDILLEEETISPDEQGFKDTLLNNEEQLDVEPVANNTEGDSNIPTEFESSTDRSSLDGKTVSYNGEEGVLNVTEEGVFFGEDQTLIESALNEDLSNAELGISEVVLVETQSNLNQGDQIVEFGQNFEIVGPRYNEDGTIKDVVVKNKKGKNKILNSGRVLSRFPQTVDNTDSTPVVEADEVTEVKTEDFTQEEINNFSPDEQAEFEILQDKEELERLEGDLSAATQLIETELDGLPETKFTKPFDEGTAKNKGLKGVAARKRDANVLVKAFLGKVPESVEKALGKETIAELKQKAKRWKELSGKTTPTQNRKKVANALKQDRETKVANAKDRAAEKAHPGILDKRKRMDKQVQSVQKALPNLKIRTFETAKDFAKAVSNLAKGYKGKLEDLPGMYVNGTIYINPYASTETTIPHEAAHYVFDKLFNEKSLDGILIHTAIKVLLENGNATEQLLAKDLQTFIDLYKDDTQQVQSEEFFAELVGWLVANESKISLRKKKSIKQAINEIIKRFTGLTLFNEANVDINDVVDLINDIAGGLSKGRSIEKILGKNPSLTNNGIRFQQTVRLSGDAEVKHRANESLKKSRAFNEPIDFVRETADRYKRDKGFDTSDPGIITKLDFQNSKEIAELYENAKNYAPEMSEFSQLDVKGDEDIVSGEELVEVGDEKATSRSQVNFANKLKNKSFTLASGETLNTRFKTSSKNPETITKKFKDHMKSNLQSMLNVINPEFIEATKQWYEGANRIAQNMSKRYDKSIAQSSAIIATLSPSNEWFNNVSNAERVMDIMSNRSDQIVDNDLIEKAISANGSEGYFPGGLKNFLENTAKGQSLSSLVELKDKAALIVVLDRVYNDLGHDKISQKGVSLEKATVKSGKNRRTAFMGLENLMKAINIYNGEPISENLGGFKVNSFYNNILNPSSDLHVTIDTHATAAALMNKLSSKDVNKLGVFSNAFFYNLIKQAYTEVAIENGFLPRELQSVLWEYVRLSINSKKIKDRKINKEKSVTKILENYEPSRPDWGPELHPKKGVGSPIQENVQPTTEQENVSGDGVPTIANNPTTEGTTPRLLGPALVREAYDQLAEEVKEQYQYMLDDGISVTLFDGKSEPYKNSQEMLDDVRNNKRMVVFSTEEGFGEKGISNSDRRANSMLQDSGIKDTNGKTLLVNDLFRAVHDYFGHSVRGNSFGAIGEENAWDEHVRMFSPLAARAMTAETRGQNSWVNFGPHTLKEDGTRKKKGDPGYVPAKDRPFAEQKMTLLPEHVSAVEEVPVKFQKPRTTKTKRDNMLGNLKGKIDEFKKVHAEPSSLYKKFKDMFDERGVTLVDIQHLYAGLNPNKTIDGYFQEAQKKIDKLNEVLDQAGFSAKEKRANVMIFGEAAAAWADKTGRSVNEWWSDIIEDFIFSTDGSDIPSGSTVSHQSEQVIRSIWEKLKNILPFVEGRKYSNQLAGKEVVEPSTPLQEDEALENNLGGSEFKEKNKNTIRGARKITDNHKAIVYITSSANVSTPVHELAHVYEMYMPQADRQLFLDQIGKKQWDTNVSERFAIGFEKFLSDGRKTDNKKLQKVFNNFKKWLRGIYNGLFRWGNNDIFLNEKMNEMYAKIFSSEITNLDKYKKGVAKFNKEQNEAGRKYNKETMTEMADILGFDLETPYVRDTLVQRSLRAVSKGLTDVKTALLTAREMVEDNKLDPGSVPISSQQAIAFDFVAGKLQKQAHEMRAALSPGDLQAQKDLQEVHESIALILSALSLANSTAGAVLGAASHRIRNEWFTPEAVIARVKSGGRDVDQKSIKQIEKLADDIEKSRIKLENYTKEVQAKIKQDQINKLNKNLRAIFKIPAIKNVLDRLQSIPKTAKEIEADMFKELNDYYATQFSSTNRNAPQLIPAIVAALQANPDIKTVKELTDYMQYRVSKLTAVEILEALRIGYAVTGNTSTASRAITKAEVQKESLKKEVSLVETLKDLLKSDGGIKSTTVTEKTKARRLLERTIKELKELARQNVSVHNFGILYKYLEDIETMYNASLTDITESANSSGNIESFSKSDINDALLFKLDQYLDQRSISNENKKQTLKEQIEDITSFIEDIEAMRKGNDTQRHSYDQILRRINEQNLHEDVIVDNELFRLKADLRRKKTALNEKAADLSETYWNRAIREFANTPRALILSFDYSYAMYQLGFYTLKNLMSRNAFRQAALIKNTFLASMSDTHFEKMEQELRSRYGNEIESAKQHGLQLPERDGSGTVEETIRTKTLLESLVNKLPIYNFIKGMRNFNERGYVAYVATMRLQEYTSLITKMGGVVSTETKREIAERINTFTGASRKFRSDERSNAVINKTIDGLATGLIAPRLYVSVFKTLLNLTNAPPLLKLIKNGGNPELRKLYTKEILDNVHIIIAQGVAMMGIAAVVNALDADDEDDLSLDPYGNSFMRIQVGDKTITMSPYATYMRASVRLATKAIIDLQGGEFHTRGGNRKQSYGSAVWDEFFKFRMNPIFNSYDLLVNKEDFLDRKVEHKTLGEKISNVYVPSIAPISVQTLVKNVAEGDYGSIPTDMIMDMIGVNSFERDPTSKPKYQEYLSKMDFKYRTKYPDDFKDGELKRSLFKQRSLEAFGNEVNALLEGGGTPTKSYLRGIQDRVQKTVANEMRGN